MLNLVVMVLIAVMFYQMPAASYFERLKLAALIGVAASLLIDGGDVAWWQIPWQWKIYQAVYNVSVWIIGGAVLAAFVPRRADCQHLAHAAANGLRSFSPSSSTPSSRSSNCLVGSPPP